MLTLFHFHRFGGTDTSHGTSFEAKYSPQSFNCSSGYNDCSTSQPSTCNDSMQQEMSAITLTASHPNSILPHASHIVVTANNQCNNSILQYSPAPHKQHQQQQPTSLSQIINSVDANTPTYSQQVAPSGAAAAATIDMSVTSTSNEKQKHHDSFKVPGPVGAAGGGGGPTQVGPAGGPPPGAGLSAAALAASSTTIEYKPKYNRRNNPDLEKRRIHFCDHLGEFYSATFYTVNSIFMIT